MFRRRRTENLPQFTLIGILLCLPIFPGACNQGREQTVTAGLVIPIGNWTIEERSHRMQHVELHAPFNIKRESLYSRLAMNVSAIIVLLGVLWFTQSLTRPKRLVSSQSIAALFTVVILSWSALYWPWVFGRIFGIAQIFATLILASQFGGTSPAASATIAWIGVDVVPRIWFVFFWGIIYVVFSLCWYTVSYQTFRSTTKCFKSHQHR